MSFFFLNNCRFPRPCFTAAIIFPTHNGCQKSPIIVTLLCIESAVSESSIALARLNLKRQCQDNRWFFGSHFVWGKIMAAVRQGRGKRQLFKKKRHLLDSAWPVKLLARLIELSWSDVRDTCASSRRFLLAQKSAKITEYRDPAPLSF